MRQRQSPPSVNFDPARPPVVLFFDRGNVEAGAVDAPLRALMAMATNADTIREYAGRIELVFDGYDSDPRALHEVPEVRSFIVRMTERFPWWFHFSSKADESLMVILRCLIPAPVVEIVNGERREQLDTPAWNEVTMALFRSMNALYARHGLTADERSTTSRQVVEYVRSFLI